MSFTFNWPRFSDQFHYDAIQMLNTALNKGNKPPIIADKIEVVELEMGTKPPELEIRDIGDMTLDQFRGIFRLTYSGDAHLVLKTKVQANPLNHKQPDIHLLAGSRGMLAAKQPLVVPMLLRLSQFKLNSYVVLVVSKQKGITLVFKTDPLQNVDINSTFDSIAVIQKFIQREIEGQLRQMFREDLPGIIHRLSQQWVKAKVEAPYLERRPPPPVRRKFTSSQSAIDLSMSMPHLGIRPFHHPQAQAMGTPICLPRPKSYSGSIASSNRSRTSVTGSRSARPSSSSATATPDPTSSHPDLENFDPTYGLRPEGLPTRSVFRGFSSLFAPNKGLADLAEESSNVDDDEAASFDMVDWDDTVPDTSPPPSTVLDEPQTTYETIPAVGGGTITRPRIYHAQSLMQSPSQGSSSVPPSVSTLPSWRHPDSATPLPTPLIPHSSSSSPSRRHTYNPYFPEYHASTQRSGGPSFTIGDPNTADSSYATNTPSYALPPTHPHSPSRSITPDSLETRRSVSSSRIESLPTPPSLLAPREPSIYSKHTSPHLSHRRLSVSSSNPDTHSLRPGSPSSPSKIVLRPSLSNSVHHLSTLIHNNHTLSPFTRSMEHFTVRSVPPRLATANDPSSPLPDRPPLKAKRRRTFRLGGGQSGTPDVSAPLDPNTTLPSPPSSPLPSSDFDLSDMDQYFRSIDDFKPGSPRNAQPTLHQRRNIRTPGQ